MHYTKSRRKGCVGVNNKKDTIAEKTVDTLAEFSGSAGAAVAGAAIGTAVAGPAGTAIGAIAGTAIEKVFALVGADIKERVFSPRENKRVGSVFSLAIEKVNKNVARGKLLRSDGFFDVSDDLHSHADEAFEATLLAAQREYEERKIPYLANLYGNIVCDDTISRETANYLIKTVSEITYRQLVILKIVYEYQTNRRNSPKRREQQYMHLSSFRAISLATEVFDLYRRSILHSQTKLFQEAIGITPAAIEVGGNGILLYSLMELNTIPDNEPLISEMLDYLSGKDALQGE